MTSIARAIDALPVDLQKEASISLGTPQFGPYHNEGPFLDSHLDAVFRAIASVSEGVAHPDVPSFITLLMCAASHTFEHLVPTYIVLHDLDKHTCLTLVMQDGSKRAVRWDEWQALCQATNKAQLDAFCREQGIKQVSYYQESPEGMRTHGKVTADRLRGRTDIDQLVVKAIETHEVAFQFGAKGGINLPLFDKTFGGWTDEEVAFALLVNYADQMGSLGEDGQPDISDFLLLAKTYIAHRAFAALQSRLGFAPGLDRSKVTKALDQLWKSDKAFQDETQDGAYKRIVRDCAIPTYDPVKLGNELAVFVASGAMSTGTCERLFGALMTTGLIPSEIGKELGKANKDVRAAIARAAVIIAEK